MLPQLSQRQKAGLAVALAILLAAPMGVSHGDTTMLTGHTTFYNGASYDPCLGSIVGIMRHRVMWFNDQVLVETYGGRGTFILATEAGAQDPRKADILYTEGVFYDFVDPNGAHWHIDEMFMEKAGAGVTTDPSHVFEGAGNTAQQVVNGDSVTEDRTYVWSVELATRPIYDDFAGADPHTYYNFLTILDTCKMHNSTSTYDGEEVHDVASGTLDDDHGHPNGEIEHQHGRFMVDLWIGTRPTAIPLGASTNTTDFETQWAGSQASSGAPADTSDGSGMPELP